uniref:EB domain-containing protein n=1 Tax=Trichuris muris TaxID=70415 RepID=A0A5S6QQX9_TRIMR
MVKSQLTFSPTVHLQTELAKLQVKRHKPMTTGRFIILAVTICNILPVNAALFGQIGYECDTQNRCYPPNSHCRFDRCHCQPGFDNVYTDNHIVCVKLPHLDEPCEISSHVGDRACSDPHADCTDSLCKCKENYVAMNGKCEFDGRHIEEECHVDHQCIVPFSRCNEQGVCDCRPGFKFGNGYCEPMEMHCLEGERLFENGSTVNCSITGAHESGCPEGMYCVPYIEHEEQPHCLQLSVQRGFCCPIPSNVANLKPTCPHKDPYIPKMMRPCCPRPCPNNYNFVDGKCYPFHLYPGDFCEKDEQCSCGFCHEHADGEKRCRCKFGFLELYGKCYDQRCFHGDPAFDYETGELLFCNATHPDCPVDYSCISEFELCCPRMPIYG